MTRKPSVRELLVVGLLGWAVVRAASALPPPGDEADLVELDSGAEAGAVTARLLSEVESIAPGRPFALAVEIAMGPGWHTYWENGGDAGLPTTVDWTLPAGFEVSPLSFPVPHRYEEEGDLVTFGYADRARLLVDVTPPADLPVGERIEILGAVSWLQCKDICIPGGADVSVRLPVEEQPRSAPGPVLRAFEEARAALPVPASSLPRVALHSFQSVDAIPAGGEGEVAVVFEGLEGFDVAGSDFFPRPSDELWLRDGGFRSDGEHLALVVPVRVDPAAAGTGPLLGAVVRVARADGGAPWLLSLEVPVPVAAPDARPRATAAPVFAQDGGPFLAPDRAYAGAGTASEPGGSGMHLLQVLLLAFLGGIILNIMPCVLPVVSLKVLGFVSKAQEHRSKVAKLGLVFGLGVIVSFLVLAVVVIVLQAAGERIGWGFQFQNPVFVAALGVVVFVFSLSLLGVFEIGGITAMLGLGLAAAERKDYADAFFHGVLTTILATPCTAPMLGTAIAFAFAQPAYVILLVFLTVAVGLALPYVLLALNPGWLRYVPKPGAWMDRFKQAMGFLLLATLVWLIAVFGAHAGLAGVIRLLSFLLVVGLFCWMHGAFLDLASSNRRVIGIWIVTLAGLGVAYAQILHPTFFPGERVSTAPRDTSFEERGERTEGGVTWEPFSPELLASAVEDGRTVFLDLTADWCWTCKVNEKTVLADDEVEAMFLRNDVLTLKGDWTRKDPEITEILRRHDRAGVPFYAVYPAGNSGPPIVLPEIINKRIVLDSLEKAGPSRTSPSSS